MSEKWTKILEAENGQLHIDVNEEDRTNLQLVVNGGGLLPRLYHAGMIPLVYENGEFLLNGFHAELRQKTPTTTMPFRLRRVFHHWDFHKMIQEDFRGIAYEIERLQIGLIMRKMIFSVGGDLNHLFHKTYSVVNEYVMSY